MSRDNIGDEMHTVIRNRRKYAAFWEYPDRKVKEWDVACELLRSMHADGNCHYRGPVESVDGDPPDCVITDSDGGRVGVEVTEFVDQKAVEMNERGKNVYREWSDEAVREKITQILTVKNARLEPRRALYHKVILVIHIDEVASLQSPELFPILDASHFPRPRNIDEAYLICSYEPRLVDSLPDGMPDDALLDDVPYPYRRLNLDGLKPPDPATEGGAQD